MVAAGDGLGGAAGLGARDAGTAAGEADSAAVGDGDGADTGAASTVDVGAVVEMSVGLVVASGRADVVQAARQISPTTSADIFDVHRHLADFIGALRCPTGPPQLICGACLPGSSHRIKRGGPLLPCRP
jgi:hypothetical protein